MSDNDWEIPLYGCVIVLLIILAAFFSASETAITSVSKFQWENATKKTPNKLSSRLGHKMLSTYTITLGATLIGSTLMNIGSSTLSTIFFIGVVNLAGGSNAESVGAGIATGVMTVLVLLFAEYAPKASARKHAIGFIKHFSIFLAFFYYLFYPICYVLNLVFKESIAPTATEDELDVLVDTIRKEGVLESVEAALVQNAIDFDDTQVMAAMTKINKVESLDFNSSSTKILKWFFEEEYTRLPITKKGNIVGIVNVKVFMREYIQKENHRIKVEEIMEEPFFISQYATLDKALEMMQFHHVHIAVVNKNSKSIVNMGIVTMEDLIEELVGELYDETDDITGIQIINDFTWNVSSQVNAKVFLNRYFKSVKITDKKLSMIKYLKQSFNTKTIKTNKQLENDLFIVRTIRDRETNAYRFIIEKKFDDVENNE